MEPFDLKKWQGFAKSTPEPIEKSVIDEITIDTRRIHSGHSLFVALEGEKCDGHQFVKDAAARGARFALVKRAFPEKIEGIHLLKVEDPLLELQKIARAYRKERKVPLLAITGSYGKTMTKDLLAAILSTRLRIKPSPESFNSQIGVALSLLNLCKEDELGIIEIAISKAGEMDRHIDMVSPQYAILTGVEKRHLNTLKTMERAEKEYLKLIESLPAKGWALIPKVTQKFSSSSPYYYDSEGFPLVQGLKNGKYLVLFEDYPPFEGKFHFIHPCLIPLINRAVKAAYRFGLSSEEICRGLSNYTFESMHQEIWKTRRGVTLINDIYTADPQSIRKALLSLPSAEKEGKKIFLFGGMRPNAQRGNEVLIGALKNAAIDEFVLTGLQGEELSIKAKTALPHILVRHFPSQEEALFNLKQKLRHGDILLIKGERKEPFEKMAKAISDTPCESRLYINLSAIRSNLGLIRAKLPPKTRIMVMVKAQGYGTNHLMLGNFLSRCGIDILGTAHVDEAIVLKEGGITQSIFVLNCGSFEVEKLVKYGLEPGVSDFNMLEALSKEAERQNKIIRCHLHVDTGMGRFGCRPEVALALAHKIGKSSYLSLIGCMTHFAAADTPSQDLFTQSQIKKFKKVLSSLDKAGIRPPFIHAANSSGVLRFDLPFCNMVRLGLAPFGLFSCEEEKESIPLKCALSLQSRLSGINICKKGESISYGRSYIVEKKEQRIGVIPLGYFDGIHRHYSGKGYILIRGKKAPMVGKICMDYMMCDLSEIPEAAEGDPVLLFGEDFYGNYLPPELFASWGETDVRELISCLGPRIERIFIDDEK